MNDWVYLFLAIMSEVIATASLKSTEGFTKPIPSIIVLVGYCAAFYFLSLTLDTISIGVAYAIWSGVGVATITVVSYFLYDQKKGGLYFNENGAGKGFGDGGIIAILKGAPDLNSDNLEFV